MQSRPAIAIVAILVAVTASFLVAEETFSAAPNSKATVDRRGAVGLDTSLALDGSGNPVVSYFDSTNGDLKLIHCGRPTCRGRNSITSPDTGGRVGRFTSLALDSSGFPVVSYYDITNGDLKLIHCNDVNCSGGGESITSPDTGGAVGLDTSLALDGSGFPVVSYFDNSNNDLKVLHCNDVNCSGGDESITSPDTAGAVGLFTSLALDGSGNPVVSYRDATNLDLKLLHCDDADCSGDESANITSPDTGGNVGQDTSLALDGGGNPVVSYLSLTGFNLKVLHCDDPNCSGGGESITSPDTGGFVGFDTSLALDDNGFPVVSYADNTNDDLKVLHCGNPNCTSGNSIASPDTTRFFFSLSHTSLALDVSGNPAVSYFADQDLKVLDCVNANCD